MSTHQNNRNLIIAMLAFILISFTTDKDPLHKREFHISLTEVKDGVASSKVIADEMVFKDGKLYSGYLEEKFGYKWIRYRINKDSVYTDSTDTEVRLLMLDASATNDEDLTVMIALDQVEWDLDGTIKITKKDKLKKYFDVVGREKGGKPKKEKKKKDAPRPVADPNAPPLPENENRK
jgi:hypothetical protein